MEKSRLVTGIKPTGDIHLGNYFGVMRQLVELQESYECYIFIADLHALNQVQDAAALKQMIKEVLTAYLAVGIDPAKVCLFQQSSVPFHGELAIILNSITSMGLLERAHAYKDALAKNKNINVGLFDYPVLMAADILLYKPQIVPVGNDQQQHVEIAQDIAGRFNHLFGQTLVIPQARILKEVAIIPGIDGRKMSKSYNNVIGLFDSPEITTKKVMSIVTDSKGPAEPKDPENCTIFALHRLFASPEELETLAGRYREGAISYKEAKEVLAKRINTTLASIRQKKTELDSQPNLIQEVLRTGGERAAKVAEVTMREVKINSGLALY